MDFSDTGRPSLATKLSVPTDPSAGSPSSRGNTMGLGINACICALGLLEARAARPGIGLACQVPLLVTRAQLGRAFSGNRGTDRSGCSASTMAF